MLSQVFLGLAIGAGLAILIDWLVLLWRWSRDGLPGPMPLPLLRNALYLIGRVPQLHLVMHEMHLKYGPLVRVWLPLQEPILSVCDPDALKSMLGSPGFKLFDRNLAELSRFREFLGGGLILLRNGEEWSRARAAVAPAFHFESLAGLVPMMADTAGTLCDRLDAVARNGTVIEMESEFLKYTFDVVCSFTFGKSFNALGAGNDSLPKELQAFNYLLEQSQFRFFSPVPYWEFVSTPGSRKYSASLNIIKDSIAAQMAQLERMIEAGDDSLDKCVLMRCLKLRRNPGYEWLTDEVLMQQMITFLFAGHDTTANMLLWATYYLWLPENAAYLQHARDIVTSVVGTGNIEGSHLPQLGYLQQVCREALRIRPSAPMRGRTPTQTTELCGIPLRGPFQVAVNAYSTHRMEQFWPNASKFDPDRFAPDKRGMHPFAFVAFGAGPRRCVGEPLSMLEGAVVLAMLLQRFDMVPPTHPVADVMHLTLRAASGVQFHVKRRERVVNAKFKGSATGWAAAADATI